MAHFPGGSQAEYGYDAVGRRVSKIFNGKTTSYGWLADEILCARSGNATEDFLFFPGCWIPLAWRQEDEFRIFICDPIGAPIEMLDPNGSVVWRRATTLWGQPLAESSAGEFCPFGFAGHFRDAESGFHYNYYRYYAPQLGRFLTSDPLEIEGGFNLYVGCSNPLTQIDPFGLFEALLNRRCDWSDAQKRAFAKKVEHYERLIERAQRKGKRGHKVSPCYSSRSARDVWEQDCGKKPPKQKKPKGNGASADCTKDIDHSTDKQLGGKNDCDNLKPLNSSVNRSLGTQMAREIREHIKSKGQKWAYLTAIKVAPPKCPETQRRTKNCI
jgi:RHS repeat-associated protein